MTSKALGRDDHPKAEGEAAPAANFIRNQIAEDLVDGICEGRHWSGRPATASVQARSGLDPARIRTRFPPEPNGYLHIGHAKAICLNFGLAHDFGGRCHLRIDDTNPVKEEQTFVDGIIDVVRWLGFDWDHGDETNLYYASDYFDVMAHVAQHLIELGYAYVDEQSADEIRHNRGTLTEPGVDSPWRNRPVEESLRRFEQMRAGEHAQGSMVVRARIDMASPNINLRDPTIYRIRLTSHHRTGADWKIYPMYSYAHPIEDALENITHSICTLEFEDQRPFYDWVLERAVPVLRAPQLDLARSLLQKIQTEGLQAQREFAGQCFNQAHKLGDSPPETEAAAMFVSWHRQPDQIVHDAPAFMALLLDHTAYFTPLLQHALHARQPNPFALPHQHEFNRLSLTYVVTSKRKLAQLVQDKHVDGWDDPRMPTLVGLRRRGFTASSLRLFNERLGVSKSAQWIDYALLEQALRDDLEQVAPRATAVLDPIKLIIENLEPGHAQACQIPVHPQNPSLGVRTLNFERELWIERADFNEDPPKGYFRLTPGGMVRLRHAYVIRCTGVEKDEAGRVLVVRAQYLPETRSGTPGASAIKVKGAIHWLPVRSAVPAQLRLFDRLFVDAQPDVDETDLMARLNPNSKRVVQAYVEPLAAHAAPEHRFQFERNGYFVADRYDHRADAPVFNLAVGLKDSWGKASVA